MAPDAPGVPPQSETDVTVELVATMLRQQHHDLADLPLRITAEGWDNMTLRLGDELAVCVPRRESSARLIESEIAWLLELGPLLPVPDPIPVRTGRPTDDHPWQQSIVPWIDGNLHSKNVINDGGRIAAAVDWSDIFWNAYGEVSDGTMKRSRASAVKCPPRRGNS